MGSGSAQDGRVEGQENDRVGRERERCVKMFVRESQRGSGGEKSPSHAVFSGAISPSSK